MNIMWLKTQMAQESDRERWGDWGRRWQKEQASRSKRESMLSFGMQCFVYNLFMVCVSLCRVCVQFVQCLCTVCAVSVYRLCTVCAVSVYGFIGLCTVFVCGLCAVCAVSAYGLCSVYV